jgi:hypothetical protein
VVTSDPIIAAAIRTAVPVAFKNLMSDTLPLIGGHITPGAVAGLAFSGCRVAGAFDGFSETQKILGGKTMLLDQEAYRSGVEAHPRTA